MDNKKIAFAILFSVSLLLLACSSFSISNSQNTPTESQSNIEIIMITAEPTAIPTQGITINQKCNNVFYPLLPGNEWIYEFQGQEKTSKMGMSVSETDSGEIMLNMLALETGLTSQTQIQCEDTSIINFPMISMNLLLGDYLDGNFEVTHISGLFMPNETAFLESDWTNNWQSEYTAQGNIYIEFEGDEVMFVLENSPIRMNWNIPEEGQPTKETISIQAGTFDNATRIHRTVEIDATANIASDGSNYMVDGTIILEQTLWYKEGIGLLKQQINDASIKAFGIQYPVILDGTIELVEYRQ